MANYTARHHKRDRLVGFKLIKFLRQEPGSYSEYISRRLKMNRVSVHGYLKILENEGDIYSEMDGNKKRFYILYENSLKN